MSLHVIGISGSPSKSSKSRTLLHAALEAAREAGAEVQLVDLADVPADALLGRSRSAALDVAIAGVARADLVVASTPVYRATYTGLLKTFFDLLPLRALQGKVALGIATAASPGHEAVLDHGLAPLFASLEGVVAPAGVFAADAAFADGVPDDALGVRVARVTLAALGLAAALRTATSDPVR